MKTQQGSNYGGDANVACRHGASSYMTVPLSSLQDVPASYSHITLRYQSSNSRMIAKRGCSTRTKGMLTPFGNKIRRAQDNLEVLVILRRS